MGCHLKWTSAPFPHDRVEMVSDVSVLDVSFEVSSVTSCINAVPVGQMSACPGGVLGTPCRLL